jgi:hypothetical protein
VVALHIISELFTSQGFFRVLQVSARSVEEAAEVGSGFRPGFIKEERRLREQKGNRLSRDEFCWGDEEQGVRKQSSSDVAG